MSDICVPGEQWAWRESFDWISGSLSCVKQSGGIFTPSCSEWLAARVRVPCSFSSHRLVSISLHVSLPGSSPPGLPKLCNQQMSLRSSPPPCAHPACFANFSLAICIFFSFRLLFLFVGWFLMRPGGRRYISLHSAVWIQMPEWYIRVFLGQSILLHLGPADLKNWHKVIQKNPLTFTKTKSNQLSRF